MSRRKFMVKREPGGRAQRVWIARRELQLPPPSETRRLRDLALAGVRPPEYGTHLGRLWSEEKISGAQFNAGKKWVELAILYAVVCQCPKEPQSVDLDAVGGTPADPDSAKGQQEARWGGRIKEAYLTADRALKSTGELPNRIVRAVCEHDEVHACFGELDALRRGLQTLVDLWAAKRVVRNGRGK